MGEASTMSQSQRLAEGAGATPPALRSLLLVDCGAAFTKVSLVGQVEERFRLLARAQAATTIAPPAADLMVGVLDAIAELERTIGRPLARAGQILSPEQEDGSGVDGVVVAMSAGGPLRLLAAGPGREAVAGLLYRSIGGLFVELETLPASPRNPSNVDAAWQRLVAQIQTLRPHGVLIVGAPFGGRGAQGDIDETAADVARWLEALRGAAPGVDGNRPILPILFTGRVEDASRLATTMLRHGSSVVPVEALSPSSTTPLSRAVSSLYEATVLRQTPGYAGLRTAAGMPAVSTSAALGGVVRYLAQHYQMNVVGVDVGAGSTSLAAATAQGAFIPADAPNAGVGAGAGHILRAGGQENIARWLSWPADERELREYILTRMLRPRALPATPRELELEYALAREAIRLAIHAPGSRLSGLHPVDVILGTGGVLANVPHPGLAALILLDALQPRGITSLVIDTAHFATVLGGAAAVLPAAAAELAESDAVPLLLGSVISTAGDAPAGQAAVRVTLQFEDGRQLNEEVAAGALARLPMALGERARLSLYPAPGVDIGLGPGQQARANEPVEGGALGLLVDARGRPLALPRSLDERAARARAWRQAVGVEEGPA